MLREALADAPSRRFFTAHAQSCLGSGLAHVALPLIAYENTRSAWAVTAVLIPDLMPAILITILPFVILAVLVRVLPPWDHAPEIGVDAKA